MYGHFARPEGSKKERGSTEKEMADEYVPFLRQERKIYRHGNDSHKGLSIVERGHVTDVHFTVSHWQPKLIAIDKQPKDDVMHLDRSGKADRLAG